MPALQLAASLVSAVLCAFGIASLLERLTLHLHRQQLRDARRGLRPCTLPAVSLRIPLRDPNIARVGAWPLGCSQWAQLPATCKPNGTGSPIV